MIADLKREVARIVREEWTILVETVERVTHYRPSGECAPYWFVYADGRVLGVRPKALGDRAWLELAVEAS